MRQLRQHNIQLPDETNDIRYHFDHFSATTKAMEIEGWAFIRGFDSVNTQIYLVMKSDSYTYVFDTISRGRPGAAAFFGQAGLNLDGSGLMSVIPLAKVKSGEYLIGIYIRKNDREALEYAYKVLVRSEDRVEVINLAVHLTGETTSPNPYILGLSSQLVVDASSYYKPQETATSLVDDKDYTFWHVKYPPESSVHWVTFDFGEPVIIKELAILPRDGNIQTWDEDHAIFQGSYNPNNETGWVSIARLFVDKATLEAKGWDWLRYSLPDTTPYRYYRILINDPLFLSMAEVKFKVKK